MKFQHPTTYLQTAFIFVVQTLSLIDFSKINSLNGLNPKNKEAVESFIDFEIFQKSIAKSYVGILVLCRYTLYISCLLGLILFLFIHKLSKVKETVCELIIDDIDIFENIKAIQIIDIIACIQQTYALRTWSKDC